MTGDFVDEFLAAAYVNYSLRICLQIGAGPPWLGDEGNSILYPSDTPNWFLLEVFAPVLLDLPMLSWFPHFNEIAICLI